MVLAFATHLVIPCYGENGPSDLFQKPFFRLISQGPAWVALFIILSGFVNSLKPIKSARAGNIDVGLSNLATSSFRRSFRLFLPATTATVLSWFICQFGAYDTAAKSDAYWLFTTSPHPSSSWGAAFEDLFRAIRTTWSYNPDNPYDQPQWALMYLLQGSMMVFMTLLMTINLAPRYRVLTVIGLYFWSFNWTIKIGDRRCSFLVARFPLTYLLLAMVGIDVYVGILLAELSNSDYLLSMSRFSTIISPPLTVLGLYLMSFPAEYHSWAPWAYNLLLLRQRIAPEGSETSRFWPTIGAQILAFAIVISPHMRRGLSHPKLLWLGKVSFPLYLLHGSFMRSILSWMVFANQTLVKKEGDEVAKYPRPGMFVYIIAIPIFTVLLFTATHFWANKVEPWFGRFTKMAEDISFGREARPPALPVRAD